MSDTQPQPGLARDPVTGAVSQADFEKLVDWECERIRTTNAGLTLVSIDFDRFFDVSRDLGDEGRESLLRILTGLLRAQTREGDVVARGPGDQLFMLLPGTGSDQALMIVEDLRRLLTKSTIKVRAPDGVKTVQISFSAGLAGAPGDGRSREEIVRKAEAALYRAKVGGRNRVCLAVDERSVLKTSYYLRSQAERLAVLAGALGRTEASLLREALDDLFTKFEGPLKGHQAR